MPILQSFLPWQELLTALEPAVTLDLRSLPEPFGQAPTVQSAHQLMRSITAWLRAASAERPLVLFLDDLHLAENPLPLTYRLGRGHYLPWVVLEDKVLQVPLAQGRMAAT